MIKVLASIVGISMVLAGLAWIGLCYMACTMADRSIRWVSDFWEPASIGVIAVIIGVLVWMLR